MSFLDTLFGFFGGLGLFLFGMSLMSDGLKKMGSAVFKKILQTLTRNRFAAIIIGLLITCFIQSSSATSVMVVGFVNASLLSFSQAVAVILGADIGTTITAWLVSALGLGKFSLTYFALPAIFVGFLINFMSKKRKRRMLGQAILGFGLLFLGLGTMSEGLGAIKDSPALMDFFATYGTNPFLGLAAGTLVTVIIQSSSVTIAIIQLMAFQGIFGLEVALPLMFGADIGTTITAQLAAIGGTKSARGVAMANTFFKLFGALLFMPLLLTGVLSSAAQAVLPDQIDPATGTNGIVMAQIAATHSVYIAINVVIFSTLLWPLLLRASRWAARMAEEEHEEDTRHLDPLLLGTPPIAIEQCVVELSYMTRQCRKNITAGFQAFMDKDLRAAAEIEEREERIDELQNQVTQYLVRLSRRDLSPRDARAIPRLLHCINDAERIGDHAENLVELTEAIIEEKLELPAQARDELLDYFGLIERQFDCVQAGLDDRDVHAVAEALALEEEINEGQEALTQAHILRLEKGTCSFYSGVLFVDMIANLEKIGDHLTNIAERMDVVGIEIAEPEYVLPASSASV
jgi:phosphate:Na+ symporter